MDPIKVEIVPSSLSSVDSDFGEAVNSIASIVWACYAAYYCCTHGWLDNTLGRLSLLPVMFLAGYIGYLVTAFILFWGIAFTTVFGLFIGWVFDIPIFAIVASWISTAYHWIF